MSETQQTASTNRTKTFKAEVQQVLDLMIHSLYSNREIFLRELISNASDACDKLRFEALQDDGLLEGAAELTIDIEVDADKRLLTIRDNGIGMNREEVEKNIGTIAHSGTRQFLEQAAEKGPVDGNLIGQFGVGFYSAFIVADRVTLLTRRAGAPEAEGVRWESDGGGRYRIGDLPLARPGTEIILHLKDDADEFLQPWTLKSLVRQYSDHIGFPIRLREEQSVDGEDGEEPRKEWAWNTINQASALWALPKSEISEDDYRSFFQHISHGMDSPLAWAHNNVEGSQNYTSLLYLPSQAPLDFMLQRDERQGLRLYVKRVFIMDAAEQLLPHYLRFMRGVVDSDDLPLNVSREILQENELVKKIRAAVSRRSLDLIGKLANDDDPADFYQFWGQFGTVLKEGIVEDPANRDRIAGLLRFTSTHDVEAGQRTSLAEYIERMPEDQDTIWTITAESLTAAANSPHLEVFRQRGIEVLLLHDRIDEWMMGYFTEFDGKPLRSVAKGEVSLDGDSDSDQGEEAKDNPLLERLGSVLQDDVAEVRASRRLTDSASCLVLGEHDMALHLKRMLEQAGQTLPDSKPVLEVNLAHPLLEKLAGTDSDEDFADWARVVYEEAVLAEGGQLEDPAGFVARLNRLMLG